jgi:hypothetical protein
MDSGTIEALKGVFSTNTNCAEWGATLVFIGLLGDIAVILIFDLFDPHVSRWQIILAGVATLQREGIFPFGWK